MTDLARHEYFMDIALEQAFQALDQEEIPVGAVLVYEDRILSRSHNQVERLHDVTAHAEILSITASTSHHVRKYLPACTLYVTLEPCPMCAGAIFWSQIGTLVFGASDKKRGYRLFSKEEGQPGLLHPKTQVLSGVKEAECQSVLDLFFKKLRRK